MRFYLQGPNLCIFCVINSGRYVCITAKINTKISAALQKLHITHFTRCMVAIATYIFEHNYNHKLSESYIIITKSAQFFINSAYSG